MGFDAGGGQQYGTIVGGVFVFNLIVGVGALSLPNGFAYAGMVRIPPSLPFFLCYCSSRRASRLEHSTFVLPTFSDAFSACLVSCDRLVVTTRILGIRYSDLSARIHLHRQCRPRQARPSASHFPPLFRASFFLFPPLFTLFPFLTILFVSFSRDIQSIR